MTWTRYQPEQAPPARQLHSACTLEGKMVVFGGYSKNKRMNDLHIFTLENTISSLQDLCIDTLVNHLPDTIPHVNVLTEELLLALLRKVGQSGQLAPDTLAPFLANASFLSEITLSTCGEAADDAWMDALAQSSHREHLLKVDLSNCKRVTDASLRALSNLPNLRVVVVDGESEVTCDGVCELREKVPGVSVVRVVAMGGETVFLEFASPAPSAGSAAK